MHGFDPDLELSLEVLGRLPSKKELVGVFLGEGRVRIQMWMDRQVTRHDSVGYISSVTVAE